MLLLVGPPLSRDPGFQWVSLSLAAYLLLIRFPLSLVTVLTEWQTFRHERLELDDAGLKWHQGWAVLYFPFSALVRVTPMTVSFGLLQVRHGLRIWTNSPPQLLPETPALFLSRWRLRFANRFGQNSKTNAQRLHYDIAPSPPEALLNELALRAPHLQREGNRLQRPTQ